MNFTDFESILKEKFPDVSADKMEKFKALEPLYKDWNSKINVISRKDIDMLYLHHVLHSLSIAEYFRTRLPGKYEEMSSETPAGETAILDLGTGGGFPGIPLAIMFPSAHFTLCDSVGKKITVASGIAGSLGLSNVSTVNARAESLDGRYDYIVSRAVTSLEQRGGGPCPGKRRLPGPGHAGRPDGHPGRGLFAERACHHRRDGAGRRL